MFQKGKTYIWKYKRKSVIDYQTILKTIPTSKSCPFPLLECDLDTEPEL